MALEDPAQTGVLACGTPLDELFAQVTEGAAPRDRAHQADCRHCQRALQAIEQAWAEFQHSARAPVDVPGDLAERVIARVRALTSTDAASVRLPDHRGDTRIADSVIAKLARAAAVGVDDVHWVSVRSAREADQAGTVEVSLSLVASYGPDLRAVAERVRTRVTEALRRQMGVVIARVDVAVEDIAIDPENLS